MTETRTRRPNPLTQYEKAVAAADKARRAHAKADEYAEKLRAASEKASSLAALKDEAEFAEAAALTALQAHLDSLSDVDTDTVE